MSISCENEHAEVIAVQLNLSYQIVKKRFSV
jgi:hypothetical protein